MNNKWEYFVSTISDNPKLIFEHLPIFESHGVSGIHFDVMDGIFVPRLGLFPELLKALNESTRLPIEVHLMLSKPNDYIKTFVENGAKRIIVHFETLDKPDSTLKLIEDLGAESCVVLNPDTNFVATKEYLPQIDSYMLMGIKPGIPKHPFIPSTLGKLAELKIWLNNFKPQTRIGIDGGVTFQNAMDLFTSGADWLICGSGTVFEPGASLSENLVSLKKITARQSSN